MFKLIPTTEKEFNENQPRDDAGRWTDSGSMASYEKQFPESGKMVDGLVVRDKVPNEDSIQETFPALVVIDQTDQSKDYNPDQPRVPAGSPEGGQFTSSDAQWVDPGTSISTPITQMVLGSDGKRHEMPGVMVTNNAATEAMRNPKIGIAKVIRGMSVQAENILKDRGWDTELIHSGSAIGPSSYLSIRPTSAFDRSWDATQKMTGRLSAHGHGNWHGTVDAHPSYTSPSSFADEIQSAAFDKFGWELPKK